MIRGTESLKDKFDPYEVFTVNGTVSRVNFNSLTPEMLSFLVAGDEGKISLYNGEFELAKGRINIPKMQEIMGVERYVSIRNYLADRVVGRNKFYSVTADGYGGDFSAASEADSVEEEVVRHRPGMRVRVLVELVNKGFRYLSWKEERL